MKKLGIFFLSLAAIAATIYACKKEPVESKPFLEKYLAGRWYIDTCVVLELKNLDTIKKDTIDLTPESDTAKYWVKFTEDKKYIKSLDTVGFSIDEKAQNITFTTTPDSTWFLPYVRNNYFKIKHERKETVGTDVYEYSIVQVFRK